MDADREREIRALAEGLLNSKRHGRIALVIRDLLQEVYELRDLLDHDRDLPTMTPEEARRRIMAYAENVCDHASAAVWGEIARQRASEYPSGTSDDREASLSS